MTRMRIGSLFCGIGGLELGLEWAGLGDTVWQVEQDAACRAVLAAHWPEVQRHEQVEAVGAKNLARVDLICGGFPCQDVSSAGQRAGLRGARSGLWREFRRIVAELCPAWVVVENVASGAVAWVDAVRRDLARLGYASLPIPIAAADVGAPHERRRVFVVAYADHGPEHALAVDAEVEASSALADAHCSAVRLEPGRALRAHGADAHVARSAGAAQRGWRAPVPDLLRVVHGLSSRMDGARPRIRALGNAVVPQCAEVIGHVIKEIVVSTPSIELRIGAWERVLADVDEVDALISDPPYGARVHAGQKHGRRTAGAKLLSARGHKYAAWGEREVAAFVEHWHPRVRQWFCVFTDSELYPVWRDALRAAGRYVFAPLACVQRGMNVRLAGDGPANWTTWLVVARPRTLARWGARPGAYHGPATRAPKRILSGAKALWLMRSIVQDYTRPRALIVDPCAGSGTTLLAAQCEGRSCIGAERVGAVGRAAQKRLAHPELEIKRAIAREQPRVQVPKRVKRLLVSNGHDSRQLELFGGGHV